MEIKIRQASLEDSRSIAKLSGQLGYETEFKVQQNRLKPILLSKEDCIYVATHNDQLIGWTHGFYTLRVETDPFVEIGGLVVDENFRNKGVGKKLVEFIFDWAKTKNCNLIRVRSNTIRVESHKFYEKLGFDLNKTQKIYNFHL